MDPQECEKEKTLSFWTTKSALQLYKPTFFNHYDSTESNKMNLVDYENAKRFEYIAYYGSVQYLKPLALYEPALV